MFFSFSPPSLKFFSLKKTNIVWSFPDYFMLTWARHIWVDTCTYLCVCIFSTFKMVFHCCDNTWANNNVREERFSLAHGFRGQSWWTRGFSPSEPVAYKEEHHGGKAHGQRKVLTSQWPGSRESRRDGRWWCVHPSPNGLLLPAGHTPHYPLRNCKSINGLTCWIRCISSKIQ